MINNFVEIFTKPTSFFKSIKHWSYPDVLRFLFTILFLPYLLYFYVSTGIEDGFTNLLFLLSIIVSLLVVFVGPFAGALITHIGVLIMGGEGYKKTFLATGNSIVVTSPYLLASALLMLTAVQGNNITFLILSLITWLIMLGGWIHALVAEVIGLKVMHKFDTFKAIIAALVIPLAISLLLIIILVFVIALGVLLFSFTLY